jgi:hypothetical protein
MTEDSDERWRERLGRPLLAKQARLATLLAEEKNMLLLGVSLYLWCWALGKRE